MRDSSDDFFKKLSESIVAGKEKLHTSPDVNYFIVSKKYLFDNTIFSLIDG